MKLLFILLFYINYVIGTNHTRKYAVKNFPKKVKPFGAGKILINSGKYVINPEGRNNTYVTVSPTNTFNDFYTVFQIVGNSKIVHGVPDSPYFPVDQTIEQKPRVKKVLPNYVWSRHKRSADEPKKEKTPDPVTYSNDKKEESTTTPQPSSTTEKPTTVNEIPKFKSNNKTNNKTDGAKKEVAKVVTKGHVNHTTSKTATKNDKKEENIDAMIALRIKVSKPNSKGARQSNKTNGTRSKTKSISKNAGRNGTVTKKPKSKQSVKRQGRLKSKTKQNKKNTPSRQPKEHQSNTPKAKHAKTDKAPKQPERKENSTNVKISKETRRLTSAREALIEDYPYVVSIQKNNIHWCSGALLNPRLVITTANCLWKSNHLSRMSVRAGSSFTDHGGQLANIQEVMKHPRWGLRKNPDNDVALMLLDRNIKFSHSVHAVDLPNRVMMPAFDDAWVTSWGAERRDGIFTLYENALQVYHAYLISSESCNNITRRFGITVSQNFVCFSQSGKTAPCTRDTGAPAVSDGVLWGIASWGIRKLCGTERFPAMFSYTASHSNMDFITNATSYLMSEQRHYPFIDRLPAVRKGTTTTTKATTEYR